MSGKMMINVIRTAVFALGLLASTASSAHGGGHGGGGWHGSGWHGGGWHGGGWHGGGWHGGGWHGGGWHGGYYGGGWGLGSGVVIGTPSYGGYYDCQTIRVCNQYGHCWLQESCD